MLEWTSASNSEGTVLITQTDMSFVGGFTMPNLEDFTKSQSKEIESFISELSVMKQLIKEQKYPLDLIRELLSNSCAKEIGATEIKVKYTFDEEGHIFEVTDNGCGMDFTGNKSFPGRLDRFLGLGLSSVIGIKSDEFSWKGLGSKLAFQSKRIEIETWCGTGKALRVEINDPWGSLERNTRPKPKIFEYEPEENKATGTSVKVYGHPPYQTDEAYTLEQLKSFLLHRTFIGFTREREQKPRILLSALGRTEYLDVGFPELKHKGAKEGTVIINEQKEATKLGTNKSLNVSLKGFFTWDEDDYGLDPNQLNTGLILSVKGIPYFSLDMWDYGSRSLSTATPGQDKCCLVVECDALQEDMNISRSDLVGSESREIFKKAVREVFEKIERSKEYLSFRQVPTKRKTVISASALGDKKKKLESDNQRWVVYQRSDSDRPIVLLREPENEYDALAILWKLEALGALPFKEFETLAHAGKGPDLITHFQEDEQSVPERFASVEIENKFSNYKAHGHKPSQYARVITWDISDKPKDRINKTDKRYKLTVDKEGYQVHVYALRFMDGIRVLPRKHINKED